MYGYGNSGNIWGIIIGTIIGIIIVFLVCRELICWYWKINKIVALLEEQNKNILSLIKQFGSTKSINSNEEIADNNSNFDEKQLIVQSIIGMRAEPSGEKTSIQTLSQNEVVTLLETIKDNKGEDWAKVRAKNGIEGWIWFSYLKKKP